MKGKELKVIDLEKKIDKEIHTLYVYAVFKDLKYGNIYAIYKDNNDITNDVLHYAGTHFKGDTLVLLNVKEVNKVEEEPKREYISKTPTAKCPECGGDLIFEGGCNTCKNCGYSKCD